MGMSIVYALFLVKLFNLKPYWCKNFNIQNVSYFGIIAPNNIMSVSKILFMTHLQLWKCNRSVCPLAVGVSEHLTHLQCSTVQDCCVETWIAVQCFSYCLSYWVSPCDFVTNTSVGKFLLWAKKWLLYCFGHFRLFYVFSPSHFRIQVVLHPHNKLSLCARMFECIALHGPERENPR